LLACFFPKSTLGQSQPVHDQSLGFAINERVCWVYQVGTTADSKPASKFAYRLSGDQSTPTFRRGPVTTGEVAQAVARGVDIHVFFADGTHWRFSPIQLGVTAVSPRAREVDLPESAMPVRLAVDAERDCIIALVSGAVAWKVRLAERDEALTTEKTADSDSETRNPVREEQRKIEGGEGNGALSLSADELAPKSNFALVRYQNGRWWFDRDGPAALVDGKLMGGLYAHRSSVALVYRDDRSAWRWQLITSGGPDAPWSEPETLTVDSDATNAVVIGWIDERPVWAVGERSHGARTVRLSRVSGADTRSTSLRDEMDSGPARFVDEPVCALWRDRVTIGEVDPAGNVRIGQWSAETGLAIEPLQGINALVDPPTPTFSPAGRHLLQYAVLGLALAAVFVWRRDRVMLVTPLRADQAFARFEKRGLAMVIDLAIVAPIWAPVLYGLWRSTEPDLTAAEQLLTPGSAPTGPMFWAMAIVGGVMGIYGMVVELFNGQTFGKRITACRVVSEEGDRASARAIILRNMLRVVEFHFAALVLLVFLTPGRQRLGDLLGRTVVVERAIPGGDEQTEEPSPDQEG